MTDAPIPLVLDLWAKGHSASQVEEMLAVPSKKVSAIVAEARSIGDPRAVYHRLGWRLIGKGIPDADRYVTPVQRTYNGFRIVPIIGHEPAERREPKPLPRCKRGHVKMADTVGKDGRTCLICKRERDNARYRAIKGLPA